MTGRTWSAIQARGRRRWTTRTSPSGAIVSWTLLAEGERVMTEGDAIVCVVDDDAPLRESLTNLLRSVGLRVVAFASVAAAGPQRARAAAAAGRGRPGHADYFYDRPRRYPDDCAGDASRGRGVFDQCGSERLRRGGMP